MPQSQSSNPERSPVFYRPACPNCAAQMWLCRIEPDVPDHDLRTFECPRCQHQTQELIKFK